MRSTFVALVGIASVLGLAGAAGAQAYRWVDERGGIHYTQTPPPPVALPPATSLGALVDEVLDATGARRTIAQIPGQVQAGFQASLRQQKAKVSQDQLTRLTDIMTRAFAADALYVRVRNTFVTAGNAPRLQAVLEFSRSPLARQMTDLERAAVSPEGLAQLQAFAERLKTSRPSPERLDLIRRLDAATGATDLNVDVALATIQSMAKVVDAVAPPGKRLRSGELDAVLARTRAALHEPTRVGMSVQLQFAYRSVSDSELAQYVQVHETDAARWFSQLLRKGFVEAIGASATSAAEELTRAFLQQKTQARP